MLHFNQERDREYAQRVLDWAATRGFTPHLFGALWDLHTMFDKLYEGEQVGGYPATLIGFEGHMRVCAKMVDDTACATRTESPTLDPAVAARMCADLLSGDYRWAVQHKCDLHLCSDSSPASFYWYATRPGQIEQFYNGGLIYHGDCGGWELPGGKIIPNGYGVETFSVCLTKPINPWSIHT